MATQCGAIDRALAGGTLTAHGPRVRQGPRPLRPLVHGSRCRRSHRPLAHWQHGRGNECLHAYRGAMLDAGLAPATVNRRLSALRSIVQLGRTFGMVTWSLEIDGVKTKAYRDTAGPGLQGVTAVKRQAAKHRSPAKAARDVAIIRLLFDLALRRGEVAMLDLKDLDLRASRLWIKGKGRREREAITLPPRTVAVLKAWLRHRGKEPGPLFINFHHANKCLVRLEPNGIVPCTTGNFGSVANAAD